MSFDLLPANLLLKIFNQLSCKDRVRISGANRLFNEISNRSINTMRSLKINADLEAYSIYTQTLPSLLETCASTLESIDATNRSCSKWLLSALTGFVFPKLKRLEITVTNNELAKKLIRRNPKLRSVMIYLNGEFEWPDDIVFEKLEKLAIFSSDHCRGDCVNLSPTIRPLIGKVPNLKLLYIKAEPKATSFILSVQELGQLLAGTPHLDMLRLLLSSGKDNPSGPFVNMYRDFVTAMPTWNLPNLTYLYILLKYPIPHFILQQFSISSPQLDTIAAYHVTEIDDQTLIALSKMKQLRELLLPHLEMTKDQFSKMITLLPSITDLSIKDIDLEALPDLPQLQHLRTFNPYGMKMTRGEIIGVMTNLPSSLSILGMQAISNARSPHGFIHFITSTAAVYYGNLKIALRSMRIDDGDESKLDEMKAELEEIQENGGPVVEMDGRDVRAVRYGKLA